MARPSRPRPFQRLRKVLARVLHRPAAQGELSAVGAALLKGMSWHQFELLAAEGFRARGYVVSETGGQGGGAVDMVLTRGVEQFLVDCKPWRASEVGIAPLQQLAGYISSRGAAGGFVLSAGRYTPEAIAYAERHQIQWIDGTRLRELLHAGHEKTVPVVVRRATSFPDTTLPPSAWRLRNQRCPLCDGEMLEREGAQPGERVLRCVHHPLCEGTLPL